MAGHDLTAADVDGKSDPYVVFRGSYLSETSEKTRTQFIATVCFVSHLGEFDSVILFSRFSAYLFWFFGVDPDSESGLVGRTAARTEVFSQ